MTPGPLEFSPCPASPCLRSAFDSVARAGRARAGVDESRFRARRFESLSPSLRPGNSHPSHACEFPLLRTCVAERSRSEGTALKYCWLAASALCSSRSGCEKCLRVPGDTCLDMLCQRSICNLSTPPDIRPPTRRGHHLQTGALL